MPNSLLEKIKAKSSRLRAWKGQDPKKSRSRSEEREAGGARKIWNSTLTRKTPLRAPWRKKKVNQKLRKTKFKQKPPKPPKKRTALRKVSKALARRLRVDYYPERSEFLSKPENQWCAICLCRGIENPNPATEVHHIRGRAGKLLSDSRFFVASCFPCREWPHTFKQKARELGILAGPGEWGKYPEK